jgi:HAD superfamily phosphatase (TIGR01668 family)
MFRWLQPNLILDSVQDITAELLQQYGLRSLLLDVDSTLKSYRTTEIPPKTLQWIESLRESGIGFCILSNGRVERIRPIAEQIGQPFIAPALKPAPFGCRSAIKTLGFEQKSTALVGDQVFADILAGKFAGVFTILVTPIHPEEERWYTRIKRPVEKWILLQKNGRKN